MLKNWKDAAISLQHILDLAPNDKYTYQNLASICHEQLFEYARAYTLHDQWLRRFPEDAAAQADFAETHFTTGRFAEFAARLKPLLANPELPAATKIALQMIEVANLLALDQSAQVPAALMALLETIAAQPADFRVTWSFNGTLHFIGTHEPLAARRDWLRQLITVLQADNRDVILTGLRAAQKQFSER
jgi:tetratricopeptide (TPR) repeat protein